jgi:hypothetical protein
MTQIIALLVLVFSLIVGVLENNRRKQEEKRKQADQARKDLDDAKKNDDVSSLLDAFGRLR